MVVTWWIMAFCAMHTVKATMDVAAGCISIDMINMLLLYSSIRFTKMCAMTMLRCGMFTWKKTGK